MVNTERQFNIQKPAVKVLGFLNNKNREVLERRFGIGREESETLESIGQGYGITRERVRQIQEYCIKKLSQGEAREILKPAHDLVKAFISQKGGVAGKNELFENLSKKSLYPYFALSLKLMPELAEGKETDSINHRYALNNKTLERVDDLVARVHTVLNETGSVLSMEELDNIVARELKLSGQDLDVSAGSMISLSKLIKLGPFGDYGLGHWPAINPKGVRDKAHLVFEKEQRPLHFREISLLIDQYFRNQPYSKNKNTHPQTVHNELIKDPRFILIGRGLYALSDWGYEPGTVKDVLVQIMKEEGKPMDKEDILELISERRFVKPNTVFLNLQNKNYFKKVEGNKYYLA